MSKSSFVKVALLLLILYTTKIQQVFLIQNVFCVFLVASVLSP